MNFYEKFISLLADWQMNIPRVYGLFHCIWLLIMVLVCILIFIFRKKISLKAVNISLIVWGCVLIFLEVFKLSLLSFKETETGYYWSFAWGSFPFQFCSNPLYLGILAGSLKKGKVKDSLFSFIALYDFVAGLATILFPSELLSTNSVFINNHTMLWHTSMVTIAFLLLATKSFNFNLKSMLHAFSVFIILVTIALIINIIANEFTNLAGQSSFNMFYISPYYVTTLFVFNLIYPRVPYFVFLFLYLFVFSLGAFLVLMSAKLLDKIDKNRCSVDEENKYV